MPDHTLRFACPIGLADDANLVAHPMINRTHEEWVANPLCGCKEKLIWQPRFATRSVVWLKEFEGNPRELAELYEIQEDSNPGIYTASVLVRACGGHDDGEREFGEEQIEGYAYVERIGLKFQEISRTQFDEMSRGAELHLLDLSGSTWKLNGALFVKEKLFDRIQYLHHATYFRDQFIQLFLEVTAEEHGPIQKHYWDFLRPFLERTYEREGSASRVDIEGLVMGVENDVGADVPPELAAKWPLLNAIALHGIEYDDDKFKEEFEKIWSSKVV